jgi:hypothetical protein
LNPPASITVLDESCMTADALATGLMVMGTAKGIEFARNNNLSVIFLDVVGEPNALRVQETTSGTLSTAKPNVEQPPVTPEPANMWLPFVAALAIFLIAVTGMAIGVILKNRAIKGSCGGLASMPGQDGKSICELCTIPKDQCKDPLKRASFQEAASETPSSIEPAVDRTIQRD